MCCHARENIWIGKTLRQATGEGGVLDRDHRLATTFFAIEISHVKAVNAKQEIYRRNAIKILIIGRDR